MKCCQKKKNMKTQILLTSIGAAVLAAITINVNASDSLLSPRAAGNQTEIVPGITAAQPAVTTQAVAPRTLGSQTVTVASVPNDVNPTIACHNMVASPKAIQACAANPTAAMPCCAKPLATVN